MLKDDIIQSAFQLFSEKGYEKTTINEIIKSVGCSKGGFYHHFTSKEEILSEIVDLYMNQIKDAYEKHLYKSSEDTLTLLNKVFITINDYKRKQFDKWPQLANLFNHQESHNLLYKMGIEFEHMTADIYERLLLRAMDEGVFQVKQPKALAGLWAREMLRIYGDFTRLILDYSEEAYKNMLDTLDFAESVINAQILDCQVDKPIQLKDEAVAYIELGRKQYEKMKDQVDGWKKD